jgi:hypothetical protein
MVHPDDQPEAHRMFEEALSRRSECSIDFRLRYPDGAYFWAPRAEPCEEGRRLGSCSVVGAFIDIHDEKRRVQDLAETAARLALAEEAGGVGLWDIDMDAGTVTYSAGRRGAARVAARADHDAHAGGGPHGPSRRSAALRGGASARAGGRAVPLRLPAWCGPTAPRTGSAATPAP